MNVTIDIFYRGASRILQSGSYPLRGRKPERVALDFWKQIQKYMSYRVVLEKVNANGEDITDLVKKLEQEELDNLGLQF